MNRPHWLRRRAQLDPQLLYEIGPWDPIAFITAPLLLASAALVATWLPARRATRIAPTVAPGTE